MGSALSLCSGSREDDLRRIGPCRVRWNKDAVVTEPQGVSPAPLSVGLLGLSPKEVSPSASVSCAGRVRLHLILPVISFMRSKLICLFAVCLLAFVLPLRPDTIIQTDADGKTHVIFQQVIVIDQDPNTIVFKHFDLKHRQVVKDHLDQGSLPYFVEKSPPSQLQQIVNLWKQFGYTVAITDVTGKKHEICDMYLDFFPPEGAIPFLESVPSRTTLPILYDQGGADDIDFNDIQDLHIQGDHLKVTMTNGKVKEGKFLMPTSAPAVAKFLGITDAYKPESQDLYDYSIPLSQVKEIQFENN